MGIVHFTLSCRSPRGTSEAAVLAETSAALTLGSLEMALVNSLIPATAGGVRVWSIMTAGTGSAAEIVDPAKKLLLEVTGAEDEEPDINVDVALAVATAARGSTWLCDPS